MHSIHFEYESQFLNSIFVTFFFTYHFLPLNETLNYDIENPIHESLNNFGFTLIHFVFSFIKSKPFSLKFETDI